jgi:dihydrolipoamide dehydrogenase
VTVVLNRSVDRVSFPEGGIVARVVPFECGADTTVPLREPELLETGLVLVTVGRGPHPGLDWLDPLGIERDTGGWVLANERMETNLPGVYAIGDMLGPKKSMLAHTAAAEGVTAARNALGAREVMDYSAIPVGVFTTPEAAGVGLTEAGARELGGEVRVSTVHLRSLGRAQAMGEIAGQVKMVADSRGKILGIHIVGPHATDLIAEAALALRMGASVEDFASTVHAHPTFPEALREAAEELWLREPL